MPIVVAGDHGIAKTCHRVESLGPGGVFQKVRPKDMPREKGGYAVRHFSPSSPTHSALTFTPTSRPNEQQLRAAQVQAQEPSHRRSGRNGESGAMVLLDTFNVEPRAGWSTRHLCSKSLSVPAPPSQTCTREDTGSGRTGRPAPGVTLAGRHTDEGGSLPSLGNHWGGSKLNLGGR